MAVICLVVPKNDFVSVLVNCFVSLAQSVLQYFTLQTLQTCFSTFFAFSAAINI